MIEPSLDDEDELAIKPGEFVVDIPVSMTEVASEQVAQHGENRCLPDIGIDSQPEADRMPYRRRNNTSRQAINEDRTLCTIVRFPRG